MPRFSYRNKEAVYKVIDNYSDFLNSNGPIECIRRIRDDYNLNVFDLGYLDLVTLLFSIAEVFNEPFILRINKSSVLLGIKNSGYFASIIQYSFPGIELNSLGDGEIIHSFIEQFGGQNGPLLSQASIKDKIEKAKFEGLVK